MKLKRVNNVLLIAILVVNGYVIALPLLPGVVFWLQSHNQAQVQRLEAKANTTPPPANNPAPDNNRLIIPSMLLDDAINDGPTMRTLRKGLWRIPHSSTPDKGSNTVIVGHRFTYSNPRGILYSLDKVHVGDPISVWWNGRNYKYKVTETKVVGPHEVAVEDPTTDAQLTVYTCTPLWLPKNRLVVVAKLQEIL